MPVSVLLGHDAEYDILTKWISTKERRNPDYYILLGKTGIGKTTLIEHVFSDYEIINFSEESKKTEIIESITAMVETKNFSDFFKEIKKIVILIQHVDKSLGDSKQFKELLNLAKKSKHPIVMTSTTNKRAYTNVIHMEPIDDKILYKYYKKVYNIPSKKIKNIIKKSEGDVRCCISNLELKLENYKDNIRISKEAIEYIKTNDDLTFDEKIKICETDFQNISEMLFYNINMKHLELEEICDLHENMSVGDCMMKQINKGEIDNLLKPFIIVSCLPVLKKIKKIKHTKLSVHHLEYNFPRDIFVYLHSFKNITVPTLFNEKKILFYDDKNKLSRELFIKLFRVIFNRPNNLVEKKIISEILK